MARTKIRGKTSNNMLMPRREVLLGFLDYSLGALLRDASILLFSFTLWLLPHYPQLNLESSYGCDSIYYNTYRVLWVLQENGVVSAVTQLLAIFPLIGEQRVTREPSLPHNLKKLCWFPQNDADRMPISYYRHRILLVLWTVTWWYALNIDVRSKRSVDALGNDKYMLLSSEPTACRSMWW